MSESTRSERVIEALKQLEQFQPCQLDDLAICALSGVQVRAVPDPDGVGHGMVWVRFPGGRDTEAAGDLYLRLKVIESARIELDGSEGDTKVARRVQELLAHLHAKHDLT